jgi:hypothetical protein
MAKSKKDKKIPKRIAGVKVPKDLRKGGESLLALVNQPLAREIAVAAAIAAVAASKDARKAAKKAREEAGDVAEEAADKVDWVGPAVTAAAAEVGRRLVDAYRGKGGNSNGGAASTGSSKAAKVVQLVGKLAASNQR